MGAAAIQTESKAFIMTTAGLLGKEAIPGDANLLLLEVAGRAKLKEAAKKGSSWVQKARGEKLSNARNLCLRKAMLKQVQHKMHL